MSSCATPAIERLRDKETPVQLLALAWLGLIPLVQMGEKGSWTVVRVRVPRRAPELKLV